MDLVRLNKYIASLDICSRRKAEDLIRNGKVKINGKIVEELGTKIDPEKDKVEVESTQIISNSQSPISDKIYIALNKPIDYISSTTNIQGASILDLLVQANCIGKFARDITERVYPVGRLDKDSEGLILITNDGNLTLELTHPRYEHEKEYEVTITEQLSRDAKKILTKGMIINNGLVNGIEIKKEQHLGKRVIVTVILREGKNRQIKKMFGQLGYSIIALKRTRICKLKLSTLPIGKWKFVKKENII